MSFLARKYRNTFTNLTQRSRFSKIADIDSKQLTITQSMIKKTTSCLEKLRFGETFTDHMLEVDWTAEYGWHSPIIRPFSNLELHPASTCFHYGLEAYEGLKAYFDSREKIRLFRPVMNMNRMNQSASALCMPMFNSREFLRCIKELVRLDKNWIPKQKGYSLYVRPTIISTEETIGISVPKKVKLFVILSPVGPYYPSGFAAVKLYANTKNVRAWPGGVGNVKAGGNYAPTIKCQLEASKKDCAQVLWLFGEDLKITEVGTMNQFFVWKNKQGLKEVITAPLDGVILAGVTRDSILSMLREEDEYVVTERNYTLTEVIEAINEDRLLEAFGSGTAAIVSPVKGIIFNEKEYKIPLDPDNPKEQSGKLTRHLFHRLLRIQYGEEEHHWSKIID